MKDKKSGARGYVCDRCATRIKEGEYLCGNPSEHGGTWLIYCEQCAAAEFRKLNEDRSSQTIETMALGCTAFTPCSMCRRDLAGIDTWCLRITPPGGHVEFYCTPCVVAKMTAKDEANAKPDDGGPAFPCLGNIAHNSDWISDEGMSLRDWLAGLAMQGVMARTNSDLAAVDNIARIAYRQADAMLAEGSKEPDHG